ncbi:uncharacterized protein LOC131070828 [Cryptomeria japonica]|uniref:uncharacterized protein LOC131070828 n=1 Tax=Cryptomeria japonica TaxID=3369 RepID=UPI0027DAA004|nr:uncharacterized protein LOC131070828 [Cryptomeria japonica]
MRLVRLMQGGLHIRLLEQATILVQRYGFWFIQFPRFSYIRIAGSKGAPVRLLRYSTQKIVILEVARQSRSVNSLLKDKKQSRFAFPIIIGNLDVHLKSPAHAEESLAELASYGLQEHFPKKCFDHDNLAKRAYDRRYGAKESVEDYWKNCFDDYEVGRREYSRLSVQQMRFYEYRRVLDQLMDSRNCLQVREFEAVRHLLQGIDWSQDPITDFEAVMAAPGSDIDAFKADDPSTQDMLNTEVKGSRHELQLHSTAKDDSTVEGEQRTDETRELQRTKEQLSHEDTRQLFSEVGENSATSKGLDTSSTPPVIEQLQICNESAENIKEKSANITIALAQTIPQDWLVAQAQRKAATKLPINLEDIFSRIGKAKSKGKKKPKAEGYIDQLLRPLHDAPESHIPPTTLAQRTTTKFEGVRDTAKAVKEWMRSIKERGEQIIGEFGFLGKLARRKSDLRLYIDELGQALYGELDYRCEATNASEFQELHAKLPFVSVPKAFHHLTRKRVLTMEWMTGDNPKELLYISTGSSPSGCIYSEQQRLEARNRLLSLVNRGVEASLVQLLETGLLHADPHPGNLVYTSTGQIGFLDFGLLCRMEEKHQYAMLASIVHIVNADWPSLVIDLADMDIIRPETDLRLIQMELQDALGDAAANDGTSMPDIKFSKVLGKIWAIALKYHFKMPPYYTLVLRSVASLEGLALAVDPDFKTFQAAYPYVVHRLLTNNSIRMRKILHSLVLNERKEFQWPKVALFLKLGEQQFKKRDALKTGGEAHVVSNPSKNPPGGSVDLANTIMKLLSSADGAVLRRLLVTADTPSLAKTFVSVDATEFRRNVVENFAEILSEWGTRILREEHIYLRQTAINHDQTDRMESSNASSLDVYKNLLRDHRLKVVLFTALKRLTRSPLLMLRVCWTCAMILCSALALASHRLLVELCHIYVQPVPVVRKRKLAYQTVA